MFIRSMVVAITISILQVGGPCSAAGQNPSSESGAQIRRDVERLVQNGKNKVVVNMTDGRTLKGSIVSVDADSFKLADNRSTTILTVSFDKVRKIRKQGMSTAAKTAIWIGVAAGAAVLMVKFPSRRIGPICPLGCGL